MGNPTNSTATLMRGLTVQSLRFYVRAESTVIFSGEPGAALRGGLYEALALNFCSETFGTAALDPNHKQRCPVCWLLAAESAEAIRGENIPRPLTIQPPQGSMSYEAGETFSFGVSLIGKARAMLPYIARAVQKMGEIGIGRIRARFTLVGIWEVHPLLDVERELLKNNTVAHSTLQIDAAVVRDVAMSLPTDSVTLELITPMRLIADKQLLHKIAPSVFVHRLIERCQSLVELYAELPEGDTPASRQTWASSIHAAIETAKTLRVGYDNTAWKDTFSNSRRKGRMLPIGGLTGRLQWQGDVEPLSEWLLWGAVLHVGKNAVKGSGYYKVVRDL